MTNLVQFPGLGLSFELSRVAFSIGDMDIYWYGVCIAFGLCLALVFAFRRCTEFGIDADSMVDVILIGVVLGIASARLYYVAMAPYNYDTIWDVLAVRDGVVESAVDGRRVVAAAAGAVLRELGEVGEGAEDRSRADVADAEGADAGGVDDPAAARQLHREGGRRRVPPLARQLAHLARRPVGVGDQPVD